MSFKLALDIGHFNRETLRVERALDVEAVRRAIVEAGGRLSEENRSEDAQRCAIAAAMWERAKRRVLGFLGSEFVILHESGFLMFAVGNLSDPPVIAFLRWAIATGCEIVTTADFQVATDWIVDQLETMEARRAAAHKLE